ncbi:MAG: tRNA (adenosine(37)-N6)-threonylcarbamoyltransferase complex transferase subunit TsaD [Coriobacteriales bacterium]|jgi:N6-L-threonylcarbamoyladenine synthase|nr:tRNA (adenosine(37)-N6)-threonylcarbamoyltransferase complex transferase subunit TsaD [Coriobacteriales bacterium]
MATEGADAGGGAGRGPGDGLVLAFDTASETIALAVGRWSPGGGGAPSEDAGAPATAPAMPATGALRLLASDDRAAPRQANVRLMPSIAALFEQNGLSRDDVSCVVCGLGPGSFTGVRICVATAKGIARGLGAPLFGASTLEAVAWGAWLAGVRGNVGVVADAMRGEVYPLRFLLDDAEVRPLDPHTVAKADEAAARWREAGDDLLLLGDGLRKHAEAFAPPGGGRLAIGDAALWTPTGAGLLRAFEAACAEGREGSGEAGVLLPLYTRLSDAEENERRRLAAGGQIAQGALAEVPRSGIADPARSEEVAYRPMAAGDLEQVCALEAACFPAGASTSGERWSLGMFADDLVRDDRIWWTAFRGDVLVGFAGGQMTEDGLQVLDVAVDEAERRSGIAKGLLARLLDDAAGLGAQAAALELRSSNTGAHALYASLGFGRAGVRPAYYAPLGGEGPREDAVLMTMPLAEGAWRSRPTAAAGGARGGAAPVVLAIETSCDETAAAVIEGTGRILSDVVASQVDFHARFGGVVPEIASRKHTEAIVGVVDAALEEAGVAGWEGLDALAVTYAPGLIGALVVGVAFAKGLSWATGLPLVRVNHLEGHIYANRMGDDPPSPPFVIALLSGGHTMLVHVRGWGDYRLLGQTLDDAVGEAFDKVAKALGLGYPGGPAIARLAAHGDPHAFDFPRALLHSHDYRFSLSGLKTAVISFIRAEQGAGRALRLPDIAASFQQAVFDVQVAKALAALEETGCATFCIGGGVAANRALRDAYRAAMEPRGIRVTSPPVHACTDNAAMIACVALDRFRAGSLMGLDDDAQAHSPIAAA